MNSFQVPSHGRPPTRRLCAGLLPSKVLGEVSFERLCLLPVVPLGLEAGPTLDSLPVEPYVRFFFFFHTGIYGFFCSYGLFPKYGLITVLMALVSGPAECHILRCVRRHPAKPGLLDRASPEKKGLLDTA